MTTEIDLTTRNINQSIDPYNYSLTSGALGYSGITIQDPATIFDNAKEFFTSKTVSVALDSSYHYRPEYLSLDLYGTTALWYVLLKINLCTSHDQFDKETILIIDPQYKSIMQELLYEMGPSVVKQKKLASQIGNLTLRSLF